MILCHRAIIARSIVRNTTTSPAIMGNSGNLKVFSTNEDNGEGDSSADVLVTHCSDHGHFQPKRLALQRGGGGLCKLTCYRDIEGLGVSSIDGVNS